MILQYEAQYTNNPHSLNARPLPQHPSAPPQPAPKATPTHPSHPQRRKRRHTSHQSPRTHHAGHPPSSLRLVPLRPSPFQSTLAPCRLTIQLAVPLALDTASLLVLVMLLRPRTLVRLLPLAMVLKVSLPLLRLFCLVLWVLWLCCKRLARPYEAVGCGWIDERSKPHAARYSFLYPAAS